VERWDCLVLGTTVECLCDVNARACFCVGPCHKQTDVPVPALCIHPVCAQCLGFSLVWLQTEAPACFKVLASEQAMFFAAANLREEYQARHATMCHTTLQQIFRLVSFKNRQEAVRGLMSAKEVSVIYTAELKCAPGTEPPSLEYVDAALTVHNRLLSDPGCLADLMAIEKAFPQKGPLDSVYKLEGIARPSDLPSIWSNTICVSCIDLSSLSGTHQLTSLWVMYRSELVVRNASADQLVCHVSI